MLGYHEWRDGLLRGLAAHHAGMLPAFRHTVEELFTEGLVKAVFATETLALGINMPARTVVLERLVKFDGEQHAQLTPGEYTQLTGRAGRRGIDVEGHAVVLWTPDVDPAEVAGLASTRTFPLRSSFAPSYNMTINLVNQMGPTQAHKLLERSFAQYQADRSVVGLVRAIERGEQMLDEIAADVGGRDAPILEYARLRAVISQREKAQSRASRLQRRRATNDALFSLRRGDIVNIADGRRAGLAVVLEPARDEDDPRPLVLTVNRWAGRISSADYSGASAKLGSMTLPKRVEHRQPRVRRDVASALRSATAGMEIPKGRRSGPARDHDVDPELAGLREQLARHPAHRLSDREEKVRLAERYLRIERDNDQIQQKVAAATNSLARTFDRIVVLLTERGFIRDADGDLGVTDDGRCSPASIAKATSWWPSACGAACGRGCRPRSWQACCPRCCSSPGATRPGRRRPPKSRPASCVAPLPTPAGCPPSCAATSSGTGSRRAASPTRASSPPCTDGPPPATWLRRSTHPTSAARLAAFGGDFVRWCRQVLDLADQVRNAAPTPELRAAAKRAIADVRRGVVAVDAG